MLDITRSNAWEEGGNEDMWFANYIRDSDGKWPISTQDVVSCPPRLAPGVAVER